MSWWGQREILAADEEHRVQLEAIVGRICRDSGPAHVIATYDALHELVDMTPVEGALSRHVVKLLVNAVGSHPTMPDESRRGISAALERLFQSNEAALEGLVNLLDHCSGKVRAFASDLLSRLVSSDKQVAWLNNIAEKLASLNAQTRSTVTHCLRQIVQNAENLHPHCVAALCTQIRSPRSFSRDSALEGLVLVAPLCRREHLVREVVACLYDASEEVRASAVKAVAALSAQDPCSNQDWILAVSTCMDHHDVCVRTTGRDSLDALRSCGRRDVHPQDPPRATTVFQDPGPATALENKGQKLMLDPAVRYRIQSGQWRLWDEWDLAYGQAGRPCIVDDHLLRRRRHSGNTALAESRSNRATIAHISKRLEDDDLAVRESAVTALCRLAAEVTGSRIDLIRACAFRLGHDDDGVRNTAVLALARLVRGNMAAEVDVVLEWLQQPGDGDGRLNHDAQAKTQVSAIRALASVAMHSDERVVKALLTAVNQPDADYRVVRAALDALARVAHFGPHMR